MAERLPVIKRQPDVICDWWPPFGGGTALLAATYPGARIVGVRPDDLAAAAPPASPPSGQAPWWSPRRWRASEPPPASAAHAMRAVSDLDDEGSQLVWANMMLHAVADPLATMRQWQRALAVDGFLMFSTLGPGTLEALRELYRRAGWPTPHAAFVDMHDLGDMLLEAGFADPVVDQEVLTLTWSDAGALLAELRGLGLNADPARFAALRTPRWLHALSGRLADLADLAVDGGRIALGFEVVYGHAFRPPPRVRVAAESSVALRDLQAMARAGRGPGRA